MCIKDRRVHTYCSYYNFTLEEAIGKKKMTGSTFPESELLYIFGSLLDLAAQLEKRGIAIADYRPDNIYLSP